MKNVSYRKNACSSDDEPKQTTYTLKWNADISSTSIVSVDVWLFEYNENGEIIGNSTINEIQSGHELQIAFNGVSLAGTESIGTLDIQMEHYDVVTQETGLLMLRN